MSTRNISWGLKVAGAYGWHPYHFHVPIILKSGYLSPLETSRPAKTCNGIALPFIVILLLEIHNIKFNNWNFLIITYQMHMVTLWTEAEYGPSSVLQILDCPSTPDTPISVTVCDFELLWHKVREIRMEKILAGSEV